MRSATKRLMVLDDIGRPHDCDLLLDSRFSSTEKNGSKGKIPPGCQVLLGTRYVILRPQFRYARAMSLAQPSVRPPRIFICFGGSDPGCMTQFVLKALANRLSGNPSVDIVVGHSYADKDALRAFCQKHAHWRLFIDHPSPEFLMAQATLAIGAGGMMAWERCAVGLPSIVISIADNQCLACTELNKVGAIYYLGHHDTVNADIVCSAVNRLLTEPSLCKALAEKGYALIDTQGIQRVEHVLYQQEKSSPCIP